MRQAGKKTIIIFQRKLFDEKTNAKTFYLIKNVFFSKLEINFFGALIFETLAKTNL